MLGPRRIALALGLMLALAASCGRPPQAVIVLCAGDSITEQAYPRYLRQAMARDGRRARVLNYGRSGFTSGEYRRFLEQHQDELGAQHPDFVLLQLGTNDVRIDGDHTTGEEFERNIRRIISLFQSFLNRAGRPPFVLVATIPPVPEGTGFPFSPESARRVAAEVNPLVRKIASELGLRLVDNHALFEAEPGLLTDIHPSAEGYRHLALNWYRALKPYLGRG